MNKRMNQLRHVAIIALILLFTTVLPVQAAVENAQNNDMQEENQIIFLIDGSYSMAGERWQEALECIQMIDAMLPSDYQTALLVYSEGVDTSVGFDQSMEDSIAELKGRKQQGYTNPGEALATALEMFDWNSPGRKYAVIISDGEISMRTAENTETAVTVYLDAVSQAAESGVIIDLLIYETEDIEDQISDIAAITGGTHFYRTEDSTAEEFAINYLFERLGIERIMLGLADSSNNLVTVSLQDTFTDRVRILLTSESQIQDIYVSCKSMDIQVVQGESFAVITLDHPREENVSLQYTLTEKGRMNAYLVKEYSLTVSAEASYTPENSCQQILVRILNSDGKDILEDQDVREAVSIYIDGEKISYEVSQGKAVITWPAETSGEVTLRVDFAGLNSLVYCEGAESSLFLEVPPPEPPEEDHSLQYIWLWVVVAGICLVFIVLLCLLLRSAKKKNEISEGEDAGTSHFDEILKHDFSGKLAIYVIKTKDEADIPPASVNLYARESREPFNLEWVKNKCRLDIELEDADKILFSGGTDHTLCVRNNGNATVMQGSEILLRGKKYSLSYNDKLLLIFNNNETEIEIHYKNMKPSEREG